MAKVKVGNEVLIYDVSKIVGGAGHWDNGDIVSVVDVDTYDGELVLASSKSSGTLSVLESEYAGIRKLTKVTERTLGIGDKVIFVDLDDVMFGHDYWDVGKVEKVVRIDGDGDFRISSDRNSGGNFFTGEEEIKYLRKVRKVKGVKE